MKIRKSIAAIGAALVMVGTTAYADMHPLPPVVDCGYDDAMNPDPQMIKDSLIDLADYLRTDDADPADPGSWPYDPIWQKRGTGSYEVHDSLARKLYEEREFGNGKKPPLNENNQAAGAAWDIRNGKYDAAVDKLLAFKKDAYKSRLNVWEDGHGYPDFQNAMDAKSYFVGEVETALECVCKLTECNFQ